MRALLLSLLCTPMALAPAALALDSKTFKDGSFSVVAEPIAADRAGRREFPKITASNNDRTEDKVVSGHVVVVGADGRTRRCDFEILVPALKKESVSLRDCLADAPAAFELIVDTIDPVPPPGAPPPSPEPPPAPPR